MLFDPKIQNRTHFLFAHSNTTILCMSGDAYKRHSHTGIRLIQWIFLDAEVSVERDWGQNKVSLICL